MCYLELLIHEHYVMGKNFQRVTTVQIIMLLKGPSTFLNVRPNQV